MTIDDLLHEFQRRKVHIAIVLDEYGGTAGLVTIEDLLEEIVGEIQDEYDVEEPLVERLDDDRRAWTGAPRSRTCSSSGTSSSSSRTRTSTTRSAGSCTTASAASRQPGDEVRVDGLRLTVETTDGRRVGKVLVVRERDVDDQSARRGRVAPSWPAGALGADAPR